MLWSGCRCDLDLQLQPLAPRNNPLKAVEYATEIANLAFLRGVYPLESVGYDREPIVIWKGLVEIFRMSYLHPPSA